MEVKKRLYEALQPLGYEIGIQGSYAKREIPDALITYYIADITDTRHYDNQPAIASWHIQVNFYSRDPAFIDVVPAQISAVLLAAGFVRSGKGSDGGMDDDTGHYAWHMDFYYTERI